MKSSTHLVDGSKARAAAWWALAALAIAFASTSASADTQPDPNAPIIEASSGFLVPVTIRGQTLHLRVDPATPAYVLLNGSAAQRLGLTRSGRTTFVVGPISIEGNTSFESLTFGSSSVSRPLMWFDADLVRGADGAINPAHLPWHPVVMRLRPAKGDERLIAIPTEFDSERGLFYPYSLGGEDLLTRFSIEEPITTATGASAAVIGAEQDGRWDGDVTIEPVRYTIERPVRKMVLGKPLSINGLDLHQVLVRIDDDLGDYKLPTARLPTPRLPDARPVEGTIVVVGKRRHYNSGVANFWLMIGRDALSQCSDMTYDRKRQQLFLRCSPS